MRIIKISDVRKKKFKFFIAILLRAVKAAEATEATEASKYANCE